MPGSLTMAIIIRNISPDPIPHHGACEYELRINDQVITHFSHRRTDGLTVCLQKAAEAAERAKWARVHELLTTINGD